MPTSGLLLLAQSSALVIPTSQAPSACFSRPRGYQRCVRMNVDPFDVPRPDPAILVSAKEGSEQQLWVAGISAGLVVGTSVLVALLSVLENALPEGWFGTLGNANAVPLGLIFAAIGAAHFAKKEVFLGIVPPKGTWGGLWQVPAPGADELKLSYAEYHVYWTGAAEVGGGLLMAASGVGLLPIAVQRVDAFLLLLLCAAVTPANVYMFTHDTQMEGAPPLKYPDSHIVRGALQVVLLADFWKLAFH